MSEFTIGAMRYDHAGLRSGAVHPGSPVDPVRRAQR